MSHPCAPQDPAMDQEIAQQQAELVYERQAAFRQQIGLVKSAGGVNWASTDPNAPVNPAPLPPSPITPINPNPSAPVSPIAPVGRGNIGGNTNNPMAGRMK